LSKIIKAHQYYSTDDCMIIGNSTESTTVSDDQNALLENIEEKLLEAEAMLENARLEARNIRKEAMAIAEQEIATAKRQMEEWWEQQRNEDQQIQKEAFDEGYRQGFAQGHTQGLESVLEEQQQVTRQAQVILQEAYQAKRELIQEAEPYLITLAVEISRKVLKEEISIHPEKTISLIKEALTRIQDVEKVSICVSLDEYSFLKSRRSDLQKFLHSQAELLILPDYAIENGGVIIRTSFGSVDARIDTQLEEIKKKLVEISKGRDDSDPD